MEPMTLEEEQNHVFNKDKAQKLIDELNSFLTVLLYFCEGELAYAEDGDKILFVLRYITKISDKLLWELQTDESGDL